MTLKHVQTVRKGTKVYRYLRLPGQPRLKLPDLPVDHPQFLAAYVTALQEAPKVTRSPKGTIAAVIETYLRSPANSAHSEGYRKIIRRHLDDIREQAQQAPMHHLRADHIQDDLRGLTPVQARDRMKAWRLICAHALDMQIIRSDPTEGVRRPAAISHVGHPAWTAEQIDAFRDRWAIGTVQRGCMELLLWTGARIGDAVILGPGMIGRDGVLAYRQAKTGDMAFVPWTCALPAYASAMEADRAIMHEAVKAASTGHMTFLATQSGRTRSKAGLGNMIAAAAAEAGFDRSAHGLRKSRAVILAESGAHPMQIGSWTGHHSLSEVAHYAQEADRRRAVRGTEQEENIVKSEKPTVNRPASA